MFGYSDIIGRGADHQCKITRFHYILHIFINDFEFIFTYAKNKLFLFAFIKAYETEPDSVYTLNELYRILYETLDKLPEHYRTVFIESFFNGKTQQQIADEMNINVKSVNRYKQKTIELLRLSMKEYLPILQLLFVWNELQ